jgi:hypothetical protein
LLSQYLDGPEVDCDLVMSEGAPVFGAITDNWPTVEPYFNETGSNCPSILPRECMHAMAWLMPAWQFGKLPLCVSTNCWLDAEVRNLVGAFRNALVLASVHDIIAVEATGPEAG